jgi:hypothetical protein
MLWPILPPSLFRSSIALFLSGLLLNIHVVIRLLSLTATMFSCCGFRDIKGLKVMRLLTS